MDILGAVIAFDILGGGHFIPGRGGFSWKKRVDFSAPTFSISGSIISYVPPYISHLAFSLPRFLVSILIRNTLCCSLP